MTVGELINTLEALPKDYQVIYESGSAYYAQVDEIEIKHKTKEVKLCENKF